MATPASNDADRPDDLMSERVPRKTAKKLERYLKIRAHKRATRRLKKERAKATARANRQPDDEHSERGSHVKRKSKREILANQRSKLEHALNTELNCRSDCLHLCIDCGWADTMSPKEISKLAQQLGRVYGTNRRSARPARLILANFEPNSALNTECCRINDGFAKYLVKFTENSPVTEFGQGNCAVLSPDAKEPLMELRTDIVYILGGIVDTNKKRNLTESIAQKLNVVSYRLPIDEFLVKDPSAGSRSAVLCINQVVEILLGYFHCSDWKRALSEHIPKKNGYCLS